MLKSRPTASRVATPPKLFGWMSRGQEKKLRLENELKGMYARYLESGRYDGALQEEAIAILQQLHPTVWAAVSEGPDFPNHRWFLDKPVALEREMVSFRWTKMPIPRWKIQTASWHEISWHARIAWGLVDLYLHGKTRRGDRYAIA